MKALKIIKSLIVGGFSVKKNAIKNKNRTVDSLLDEIMSWSQTGDGISSLNERLTIVVKSRKRAGRTLIHNTMSAFRGYVRGKIYGKTDWVSIGILDGGTTIKCAKLSGKRYRRKEWNEIPDKPPRTPPPHPCRSSVLPDDGSIHPETFSEWLKGNKKEVKKWLGEGNYNRWKDGNMDINRFIDLKGGKLWTRKEMLKK